MKRTALLALFLILASVNAFAAAPIAEAGDPQTTTHNVPITILGTCTDDVSVTDCTWSISDLTNCSTANETKNGIGTTTATTSIEVTCNNTASPYTATLTAKDGVEPDATDTAQITVNPNEAPVATNVQVSPASPKTNDNLTCNYTYFDTESDPEGATTFKWFKDDVEEAGETTKTLNASKTTKGEKWKCKVTPIATQGTTEGTAVESAEVTIENSAPIAVLNVSPGRGKPPLTVTLSGFCEDFDGNADDLISCKINFGDENSGLDFNSVRIHEYNNAGTYTITLTATDANNTIGTDLESVIVDATAPTTTASGVPSSWSNSSVNVTLSCTDSGGGSCAATAYRVDSDAGTGATMGNWSAYGTQISFSAEGSWALDFNSTDSVGNVESTKRATVLIDKSVSAPSPSTSVSTNDVTISWSAVSDSLSGMNCYYVYRSTTSGFSITDSGVTTVSSCTTSTSVTDSDLSNGTYYYKVKAVDNAGNGATNVDSVSATVSYSPTEGDTTAPYLAWRSPASNSTVSGVVALQVEAYDSQSDMRFVSFYVDGVAIDTDTTAVDDIYSIDWNSASVPNGGRVLKALAKNRSGNTGYDTTTMEITVTTDNGTTALTPEQRSAKSAIDAADDAKEEAAALFNEAGKLGISFSAAAGKLLSDGSGLLDEANGLFDDANYAGAEEKADAANAKFEELLGIISIEEYGGVQLYAFSSEKLQLLLQGVGLRKELADEAQALLQNFTVNRSTLFKEITDGSNTYYKAAIRLSVKNNSGERKTVQFIEVIPKAFAADANKIAASPEFTVIVADPVIKWAVSVPAGDEKEITYFLNENLSKEAMDALIAKEPMQLFVVPPVLLGGDTAVAALDFTPAPAVAAGFFALPDLGSVGTLALVLVIVAVIAIALFAYYRGSGGSGNFGGSEGLHNFGMQEGLGKRLGGRFAGFGRAREKEQRPRWEFKG